MGYHTYVKTDPETGRRRSVKVNDQGEVTFAKRGIHDDEDAERFGIKSRNLGNNKPGYYSSAQRYESTPRGYSEELKQSVRDLHAPTTVNAAGSRRYQKNSGMKKVGKISRECLLDPACRKSVMYAGHEAKEGIKWAADKVSSYFENDKVKHAPEGDLLGDGEEKKDTTEAMAGNFDINGDLLQRPSGPDPVYRGSRTISVTARDFANKKDRQEGQKGPKTGMKKSASYHGNPPHRGSTVGPGVNDLD